MYFAHEAKEVLQVNFLISIEVPISEHWIMKYMFVLIYIRIYIF